MAATYEKVRDLGKVPLGTAWIGRDPDSGLAVVVKKIPLEAIGGGGNGWSHMVDETRSLTRIGHPQIAPSLEVGEVGDDLVMVTGQPQGRRLSDILNDGAPIGADELRKWMVPLLEGLAIAHDSGVIHRHVHEDLIVVDEEDNAVLTGFALTLDRRVDPDPIPPELVSGGKATAKSDQFLVGAMLQRLADVGEPIPALDIVVARAMAQDPRRRFPDLIDMQQSLDAVLSGASDRGQTLSALDDGTSIESRSFEAPEVVQDRHEARGSASWQRFLAPAAVAVAFIAIALGFGLSDRSDETSPMSAAGRVAAPSPEGPMVVVSDLLAEGRLQQAASKLEQIIDNSGLADPTPALDALGTIRLQEGRGEEAVDLFEQALALRADEGLYYKLSLAQASVGRDDKALRTVDEGLRLFPKSERLQEAKFHLGGV